MLACDAVWGLGFRFSVLGSVHALCCSWHAVCCDRCDQNVLAAYEHERDRAMEQDGCIDAMGAEGLAQDR